MGFPHKAILFFRNVRGLFIKSEALHDTNRVSRAKGWMGLEVLVKDLSCQAISRFNYCYFFRHD